MTLNYNPVGKLEVPLHGKPAGVLGPLLHYSVIYCAFHDARCG